MIGRVLVISQLPPPIHGSTVMTRTFLDTLDELGYERSLLDRRFSSTIEEVGKFTVRKCLSTLWLLARLVIALLTFRPRTVVFFATNRTFSFLVDWALSEILRLSRARTIFYIHTVGFRTLANRSRRWESLIDRMFSSADAVVCLGPTLAEDVKRWVEKSQITFIPNTVANSPEPPAAQIPKTSILYFSNLIPEKGVSTFIDLAVDLAPELPGIPFIVAGAPVDTEFADSMRQKVRDLRLESRVTFLGAVTDATEKFQLLRRAAVLVFPSTYPFEAQPLTIVEALAAGTPVVAYDTGGIADLISNGVNGHLVAPADRRQLASSVREALADADHLSAGARSTFMSRLSPDAFLHRWSSTLSQSERAV